MMFKELFVFEKQRTKKEALGFFLAYSFFASVVFGMITGVLGERGTSFSDGFEGGYEFGLVFGPYWHAALSIAVSLLVLSRKGHLKSLRLVLIGLSSGLMAMFVGGLGWVAPAYLTTVTRSSNN